MDGFVLIGGTALSLQIAHRQSEDLDFWLPMSQMSSDRVNAIMENLKTFGCSVQLMTPAWQITQSRINGQDLLSLSRDYVVDGVKMTFFARDDAPYRHFASLERFREDHGAFELMSIDALFAMKSWLLSKRVRSRDLFDLMVLIQDYGKSVRDVLDAGTAADASFSAEYAKEVLVGNVPLDSEDEGFDSISLDVQITDLYACLSSLVTEYEISVAREIFRTTRDD